MGRFWIGSRIIISNWFTLKRGLAVSIALSGSGLGGVILSPVTSAMIAGPGWRAAFLVLAVICLVAALLASIPAASRLVARRTDAGAPMLDAEGFEIAA